MAASRKNTAASTISIPRITPTTQRPTPLPRQRLHHRRQQHAVPHQGVSDSTLTGRQWGIAPRLGVAWSPKKFNRQDRGSRRLGHVLRSRRTVHLSFARLRCRRDPRRAFRRQPVSAVRELAGLPSHRQLLRGLHSDMRSRRCPMAASFQESLGRNPRTSSHRQSQATSPCPMQRQSRVGLTLFSFADYNRANKLPYTLNQTLDIQWQPRNDLAIESATSAISAATKSFPSRSTRRGSPRPRTPSTARTTPMATR